MARYARTAAGAKEAKTSPSRSKSRAATRPRKYYGMGKRGLSESETIRQGLMKGMKEFPPWAKPATKSRAAKGTIYGGMGRAYGDPSMGGRGRGGRGLPESEQVRTKLAKTIDRLTGKINKSVGGRAIEGRKRAITARSQQARGVPVQGSRARQERAIRRRTARR